MIEAKVTSTASRTLRASVFLKNQLRKSVRLERGLEKKSISIKKKLVKDRNRTLKALLSSSTEERKDKKGDPMFSGSVGPIEVLVFKNNYKQEGTNQPDYILYVAPKKKQDEEKIKIETAPHLRPPGVDFGDNK